MADCRASDQRLTQPVREREQRYAVIVTLRGTVATALVFLVVVGLCCIWQDIRKSSCDISVNKEVSPFLSQSFLKVVLRFCGVLFELQWQVWLRFLSV